MNLIDIQSYIYSLINDSNCYDYKAIPSGFDFINNKYAIEINVASSVVDVQHKEEITLQIRIVGNVENKIDISYKATELDNKINNKQFNNFWIVRADAFMQTYTDVDKVNCVLNYYINDYK